MSGENHEERQARSLALEKAYVHDVYDQIAPHFTDTRYRPWPRVKQFILELEPGSLVADIDFALPKGQQEKGGLLHWNGATQFEFNSINLERCYLMGLHPSLQTTANGQLGIALAFGCGNGKYLDINPDVMKIGSDRCAALTAAARSKNFEVLTSDNLHMPFRDETFDAVLSIAVIHHFATTDRRIAAIKELTRVLRIGGKVLITVWAMEQRHRKFDSQDVLVPWHEPVKSSSE
ncbi:probable tRNA methyltransferase 9B, partial [Caerostris darwini]